MIITVAPCLWVSSLTLAYVTRSSQTPTYTGYYVSISKHSHEDGYAGTSWKKEGNSSKQTASVIPDQTPTWQPDWESNFSNLPKHKSLTWRMNRKQRDKSKNTPWTIIQKGHPIPLEYDLPMDLLFGFLKCSYSGRYKHFRKTRLDYMFIFNFKSMFDGQT